MSRLFDVKLYREGMRYLKNFGIISAVILTAFPLFLLASEIFDSMMGDYRGYISASSLNPLLVLIFCVVAPLMTIMLFNFTTNRAASDFYFSVPKTRTTLYFSFFLSVLSWVAIILVFSIVVPMLVSLAFYNYVAYNFLSSIIFMLQLAVSSIYIIAACLIAISVTGTVFSNIAVALLIIFIPRIFILAIVKEGVSNLYYVSAEHSFSLLSLNVNLPVGFVLRTFTNGTFSLADGVLPIAYTVIVGIIYLVIGWRLFLIRKSETASKAAATDKLRAIFRITLASSIGLAAAAIAYEAWGRHYESDISFNDFYTWFAIIAILAVAFAAYCCYELVMTKSLRTMVKSMPAFLLVLLVDIVALGGMFGVRLSVESYQPTADEITGVYISYEQYEGDYWSRVTSDIKVKDKTVNEIVSAALKDNIKTNKEMLNNAASYWDIYESYEEWRVYIESGGRKHFRSIMVPASDSERMVKTLNDSDELRSAFTDLPDPDKNDVTVYADSMYELTESQRRQLYKTYRSEVKSGKVPFTTFYNDITDGVYNALFGMYIDIFYGTQSYTLNLQVTRDYPATVNLYMSFIEKQNAKEALEVIKELEGEHCTSVEVNMDNTLGDNTYFEATNERCKKLAEILKEAKTTGITAADKTLRITFYRYDWVKFEETFNENFDGEIVAYFSLTEEQIEELQKLVTKTEGEYTK